MLLTEVLDYSEYISAISDTIRNCEKELIILSPWFSLEGHLKEDLVGAIKRDVNITILTREPNSIKHKDSIKFLEKQGVSIIYDNLLHAKLIFSDRQIAIIGSANFQETGLLRNHELVIYSEDPDLLDQIKGFISELEQKLDVSIFKKSNDRFSGLLSKLIGKIKEQNLQDDENFECPNCGGQLILRESSFGKFYGCSNYPKCRYRTNISTKSD